VQESACFGRKAIFQPNVHFSSKVGILMKI
jgi:hypothetical protein